MKKTGFVLLLLVAIVLAQNTTNTTGPASVTAKPVIPRPVKALYMAGKGIAVNPDDLTDFALLKGSAGKVKIGEKEKGIGVLHVDDKRYVLKEIEIKNGSFYAVLYESLQATSAAGRISLDRIDKPAGEVWAGVLAIGDQEYYAYMIGFHVPASVRTVVHKAADFCQKHPENEKCKEIKQAAQNRIREYCEKNPEDRRCKAVVNVYCASNIEDTSCRARLKEYCRKYPNAEVCTKEEAVRRIVRPVRRPAAERDKVKECYSGCIRECRAGEENETAVAADFSCAVKCKRECSFQPENASAVRERVVRRVREERVRMPELGRRVRIVPVRVNATTTGEEVSE